MLCKSKIARGLTFVAAAVALATACSTPAAAADRRVIVVNNTGHVMTHLYAAGRVFNTYHDWLGASVLRPGQWMQVNFSDDSGYCNMTVVAKFNDGDEVTNRGFNVCTRSRMEFTGN